jgi:hypothetical protein
MDKKIIYLDTNLLIPYINNSRTHSDKQISKIAASIKEFGFTNPILIDKKNNIIAGHGRVLAAKKLNINTVPCIILNNLNDYQKKAYIIADNKLALEAGWDEDILKNELKELEKTDFDLNLIGFDEKELEYFFAEDVKEDDFDENKVENISKIGDIFELDRHKLICGNSFDEKTFECLLGNIKPDFVLMDPPFDLDKDDWITNLKFAKKGCPKILMGSDKQILRLSTKIDSFRHFFIHDRNSAILLNNNMPMSKHTVFAFFCENPGKHFINLRDGFSTIIKCDSNYNNKNKSKFSKMGKPVEIPALLIKHYTKTDDVVLDMFGGGGSTLIACEQINRSCYISELSPEQCDIIISRWEQFTNKKACKINK